MTSTSVIYGRKTHLCEFLSDLLKLICIWKIMAEIRSQIQNELSFLIESLN